jgi:hypothetical protein
MRVLVETYGPQSDRVEREVSSNADIEALLGELDQCADATLSLGLGPGSDEVEVIVGITPEGYVLTRYHEGDFQQLLGTPNASGEVELRLGGLPTPTPKRWLVNRAEVSRVLDRYARFDIP